MTITDYLLEAVKPEEFQALKDNKPDLVSEVMAAFNDVWKPRVKDIKAQFKYNPQRGIIGIYLLKNGQEQLVLGRQNLSEEEQAVVGSLYLCLDAKLTQLRLPKEKWVE